MNNYTEQIKTATTKSDLTAIFEDIKNDIADNVPCTYSATAIIDAIKRLNKAKKDDFTADFVDLATTDKKSAFDFLLNNRYYTAYSLGDDGLSLDESTRIFKFADLEKGLTAEDETATVFMAKRFYGLTSCFMRNLQKTVFDINEENGFKLDRLILDGDNKTIFTANDGECFKSNSNTALDKQLNIIVKVMGFDVAMRKTDLAELRIAAQKVKKDKQTAHKSVNAMVTDKEILRFADDLFSAIARRHDGQELKITTVKETKVTDKEKAEGVTATATAPDGVSTDTPTETATAE